VKSTFDILSVVKVVVDAANFTISEVMNKIAEPTNLDNLANEPEMRHCHTLNLLQEIMRSHVTYLTAVSITVITQLVSTSDEFMNTFGSNSVTRLWDAHSVQYDENILNEEQKRFMSCLDSLKKLWNSCLICKKSISHFILEGN
jgi:hypothetical protein